MPANTAAGALSRFLSATPDAPAPNSGALMERLASLLQPYGDEGLELSKAVDLAGLSKSDFLTVLSPAQANNVLDVFEVGGVSKIRLGSVGKSLF